VEPIFTGDELIGVGIRLYCFAGEYGGGHSVIDDSSGVASEASNVVDDASGVVDEASIAAVKAGDWLDIFALFYRLAVVLARDLCPVRSCLLKTKQSWRNI